MINLDWSFVFQLVNFLLLLFILNIFLFKPIRKILADRESEINGAKEKSAVVDKDVQEKMALYETRMREIKARATDERGALKKEAQAEEAAIIGKARGEAAAALSTIKEKVAGEAAAARTLLREQAASLSSEICAKVLGRSF